ncbi:MAG: YbaK/EbsC family protein [Gemmataceae bacterium]|nr:YbaK/EbsC family protein [Gemmataceae bacterium]
MPAILSDCHVPFETMIHPPAYTATKRAKYLHLPGAQVAKCVLLRAPAGFVLAVLPATRHVDTIKLEAAFEGPVRLATTAEVADVFRDCEWGVVAPFGKEYGLPTIIDESLRPDDPIVLEVNTRAEAVRMRCRDFEELEQPRRLRFAR